MLPLVLVLLEVLGLMRRSLRQVEDLEVGVEQASLLFVPPVLLPPGHIGEAIATLPKTTGDARLHRQGIGLRPAAFGGKSFGADRCLLSDRLIEMDISTTSVDRTSADLQSV